MTRRPLILRLLLALLPLVVWTAGCGDDVVGPASTNIPALDNLWPTGDDDSWVYQWLTSSRVANPPTLHASPDDVPPVPDFDTAYALLDAGPAPESERFYELALEGPDTTVTGIAGHRLSATAFRSRGGGAGVTLDGDGVFLEHLARYRPDLRSRMPGIEVLVRDAEIPDGPLFLRGGVLVFEAGRLALYGDSDENPMWIVLTDGLSVGSEFTVQLAPSISDDVYLHAQVRRRVNVEVGGRTFRGCVEVLYVLDLGVVTSPDGGGEGYHRAFDIGTVLYAPSVGPIASDELVGLTSAVDDPGGSVRTRLELRQSDFGSPTDPAPVADLQNLWPNGDGDRWTYRCDAVVGRGEPATLYDSREEVPALPGYDEMLAWLESPFEATDPEDLDAYMRLEFDGMKTTDSGAVGQDLTESFWYPHSSPLLLRKSRGRAPLLAQVLRLRPDLHEAAARAWPEVVPEILAARSAPARRAIDDVNALPLFLFGYAWEKTSEHIGTYGDLDQLLAWKFLDSDLELGHEFAHQLVPAFSDDVWLYGRVIGAGEATVGGQTYDDCIEVAYAVDYGVAETYGRVPVQYFRPLHVGTVLYAAGVGPVACHERVDFKWVSVTADLGSSQWTLGDRVVRLVEAKVGN